MTSQLVAGILVLMILCMRFVVSTLQRTVHVRTYTCL
jgi:hypothetical protein